MPSRKQHLRVLLALGWYEPRLHRGIADYALKAGWHLCADVTKEKVIPWGWEGDGILAWLGADEELARFVIAAKLPTVDFSCRRLELPFPRVLIDNAASAGLITDHFLLRGFRHFMYYSAQDNWAFERNGHAFTERLKQEGHDCTWIRWHKSSVAIQRDIPAMERQAALAGYRRRVEKAPRTPLCAPRRHGRPCARSGRGLRVHAPLSVPGRT